MATNSRAADTSWNPPPPTPPSDLGKNPRIRVKPSNFQKTRPTPKYQVGDTVKKQDGYYGFDDAEGNRQTRYGGAPWAEPDGYNLKVMSFTVAICGYDETEESWYYLGRMSRAGRDNLLELVASGPGNRNCTHQNIT